MKAVAVISVRMDSSRLPGKALLPIYDDLTSIDMVYNRLQRSNRLDEIIVATSTEKNDDLIEELAIKKHYKLFRGDKDDVLKRIYDCAKLHEAQLVLRICGDSPFIDPELIDWQISKHIFFQVDYSANYLKRTFPLGVDVDAISIEPLIRVHTLAKGSFYFNNRKEFFREHGSELFVLFHPEDFTILSLEAENTYLAPNLRFVMDFKEDLDVIRKIAEHFNDRVFSVNTKEIISFLMNSHACDINKHCINNWPSYIESQDFPISMENINYVATLG